MLFYIITGAFILLDFITGIIKAFKNKEFTSSVMREGLFHKFGSIVVIVFGALVDYAQGFMDLGVSIPLASTICIYISLMEIGSIIENVCIINPSFIPSKLQGYFQKLSKEVNKTEKEVNKTEKEAENLDDVQGTKR